MKKARSERGLRPEYPRTALGRGIRGKYIKRYQGRNNLILLSPDLAEAFPTEKDVNDALRSLVEVARRSVARSKRNVRHPAR